VLRIDARRTSLILAVPVLALIGTVAAWRALLPGVAYWDDAIAALFSAIGLLGPASAAFAAWIGMRERRLDYLRGMAPRSPALGPLIDLLLLGAVTTGAFAIVSAVVATRTMIHLGAGHPKVSGLLAGTGALLVYTIIGYIAGRTLPHLLTVAGVALVTYLWGTLRPATWYGLLPPPDIGHVRLFAALRNELLASEAVWSFGLAALLVSGYLLVLTRRRWLALPLVAAAAVTACSTAWIHGQQHAPVVPRFLAYACRQWPLTVCVHPALRTALPTLENALTPLATRLSGTPGRFFRVEHRPDYDRTRPGHGIAYIHLRDLSPGFEHRAEREINLSLLDGRSCGDPRSATGAKYSSLISAWLLDEMPPRIANITVARTFARWDEMQRRVWLRNHYWRYCSCRLSAADFRVP
jgi:succinate dehydrogenase hydrophobic anchor subunit